MHGTASLVGSGGAAVVFMLGKGRKFDPAYAPVERILFVCGRWAKGVVFLSYPLVRLFNAPAEPTKQVLHQPKQTLLGRANHVTSSAMVFYTSARAIERELNSIVTKNQILGYAVAHEIGHLLLASDAHSLFGIMKENYGHQDYIAMGQAHLAFTTEESRLLRVRVLSGAAW